MAANAEHLPSPGCFPPEYSDGRRRLRGQQVTNVLVLHLRCLVEAAQGTPVTWVVLLMASPVSEKAGPVMHGMGDLLGVCCGEKC